MRRSMPTIIIAAYGVAGFPEGGGHLSVYLQYVRGLRQLGCDVYWLEAFRTKGRAKQEAAAIDRGRVWPLHMLRQRSLRVVKGAYGFHKNTADVIVGIAPFDVWLQRTRCEVILDGNRKFPASRDFGNDLRLVGGVVNLAEGRI